MYFKESRVALSLCLFFCVYTISLSLALSLGIRKEISLNHTTKVSTNSTQETEHKNSLHKLARGTLGAQKQETAFMEP